MEVLPTTIHGAALIRPKVFADARGFFFESWHRTKFAEAGFAPEFVQDNRSVSARHVLRGLHYQLRNAQGKLVSVVRGEVFDVIVDLRRSSPSFGRWESFTLNTENRLQLYIPPGCAHGILALAEDSELHYKCTDFYTPEHERTLLWNDPDLAIRWPLTPGEPPILSPKDAAGTSWRDCEKVD